MNHLVRHGVIATLLVAFVPACGDKSTPEGPADCASLSPGLERDRCLHEEIKTLPAAQAESVLSKAKDIQDDMVRGAAVLGWIGDHNAEVQPQVGNALCQLLEGRDQSYCQRLLSSPHLQERSPRQ